MIYPLIFVFLTFVCVSFIVSFPSILVYRMFDFDNAAACSRRLGADKNYGRACRVDCRYARDRSQMGTEVFDCDFDALGGGFGGGVGGLGSQVEALIEFHAVYGQNLVWTKLGFFCPICFSLR